MKCKWHLCDNEANGTFCSKNCSSKFSVQKRRKVLKYKAFEYKGGKCEKCGIISIPEIYDFHHIDPLQKDFSISAVGNTYSWDKIKKEIDKCILLCANCHRQIHAEMHISCLTQNDIYNSLHYEKLFKKCFNCKEDIFTTNKYCKACRILIHQKIQWPSKEELEVLISSMPLTQLSKILGVSGNAIKKHCKKLSIFKGRSNRKSNPEPRD